MLPIIASFVIPYVVFAQFTDPNKILLSSVDLILQK